MALLWIDGFEGYGVTGTQSGLDSRYIVSNTTYYSIFAGRNSGYCVGYNNDGSATITTPILYTNTSTKSTNSTLIAGYAFKLADSTGYSMIQFNDNAVNGVSITISGSTNIILTLKVAGSTVSTFTGPAITFGFWYYIELKTYCDNTAGTIEVRVNGTTVISLTSYDTKIGVDNWFNNVTLQQYHSYTDDLYICDGSGTTANDFQGVCKVFALYPVADTTTIEWTPSAGLTHYNLVDENPAATADYISATTQNKTDSYTYPALASTGQIIGLQIATRTKLASGTSIIIETPINSNSLTDVGADLRGLSTSYLDYRRVCEIDPNTEQSWTASSIAAAHFGIRIM
jgi:hypothetical protein